MNRQKNLAWNGSYTIEAAFIVPIILGIVFAWMLQLFYLHDQAILNGTLKEIMIQEQIQTYCQTDTGSPTAKKQLQEHLWILKVTKCKRTRKALRVQYQVESKSQWQISLAKRFLGDSFLYQINNQCYRVQPDWLLRIRGKKESEKKE